MRRSAILSASSEGVIRRQILVVEDDEIIRQSIASALRAHGEVIEASTVAEGITALEHRPGIVVLDVVLPDGNGVEVARKASRLRPLPRIFAMSGAASRAHAFELGQFHVEEYFEKPFDISRLLNAIRHPRSPTREVELAAAHAVGHQGLGETKDLVRQTMMDQAVALCDGNRSSAARMLRVQRGALRYTPKSTPTSNAPRTSEPPRDPPDGPTRPPRR